MTKKNGTPLTPEDALDRIRAATDSSPPSLATDAVPVALLDKAWQLARSYRQWVVEHPFVGVVASDAQAANDLTWTECALGGMAAETPSDGFSAMRRVPNRDSGERWSLSRYPIVGQRAVYLMFEAHADSIERYAGCRIQVLAEGKTFDLGTVNNDGAAELRLDDTVDISRALVRIGRRIGGNSA